MAGFLHDIKSGTMTHSMKLCVLHLSDLHFKAGKNLLSHRPLDIARAVGGVDPSCSLYLLLVSGDIAFSGSAEEYEHAKTFFIELKREIETLKVRPSVNFAFIPGNHDCDIQKSTDTRNMAAEYLHSRMDEFVLDGSNAMSCLAVQQEYFRFQEDLLNEPLRPIAARFAWQHVLRVNDVEIVIRCINTAWLSKLHEKQGELLFPLRKAWQILADGPCALALLMLHHPYNWFPADMAREMKTSFESWADIIMTGHEHHPDAFTKDLFSGDRVSYSEGAVLQDSTGQIPSGFNVIQVDLSSKLFRVHKFKWVTGMYSGIAISDGWTKLPRTKSETRIQFANTEKYDKHLRDIGTGFTHSSRRSLSLRDVFVYPDVQRRSFGRQRDRESSASSSGNGSVQSANLIISEVVTGANLMMLGDPLSGKTSLAKIFYDDLRKRDIIPLLASGKDFTHGSGEHVSRQLQTLFGEQYPSALWESYVQLKAEKKTIIVDDFQACLIEPTMKATLLGELAARFGSTILFADELAGMEMLSELGKMLSIGSLSIYNIRELGHLLRAQLIQNWVGLDNVNGATAEDRLRQVSVLERLVMTVLGKNLLPSFPIVVLTILQAWESSKDQNFTGGSYGYLYETLIIRAISLLGLQPTQIDVVKTYLSMVANTMRELDVKSLSSGEYRKLEHVYYQRYKVPVPPNIVESLKSVRVLRDASGGTSFQYPYYYYFFAAMYLRDRMGTDGERSKIRGTLQEMTESVHYTDYGQILLFFVYLTKDTETIRQMLASAKRLYDEYGPCDLDNDIKFANHLYTQPSNLILDSVDHQRNREDYRKSLDEQEESVAEESADMAPTDSQTRGVKSYDKALSDSIKLNVAIKMLQILGQVLRTSPGSLEADIKQEVTHEAYLLGLRTLNALLRLFSGNIEPLRAFLAELIKEEKALKKKSIQPAEMARLADEAIIHFTEMSILGMTRRISQAVGTEYLDEIYSGVLRTRPDSIPFKLIDLSIQLDLMKDPPEEAIKKLNSDLKDNFLAQGVLRNLVYLYLYLNPVNYKERQRLTSMMNISTSNKKLIDNPAKRRR